MTRRIVALLTLVSATLLTALLLASPASASPVVPGGFCDNAEVGKTRQAPSGRWYHCKANAGGKLHWRRVNPSPTPTEPSPSASTNPADPADPAGPGVLPKTGASTGIVAGTGAVALATGTGLFLIGRRRRIA